jgi:hypothetical protein
VKRWLVGFLGALSLGCEEEPLGVREPTEQEAVAIAEMAQAEANLNAGETGDRSLDDCLARLRRETPSSAQWTIGVLGYDDFMLDTCRAQLAEDSGDAEPCRAIEARLVQHACLARVAVKTREPALCPQQAHGADPLCVALASRQSGLCQASPLLEREACIELLGDARHGCRTSVAPELCADIVARHRGALDEDPSQRVPEPTEIEEPTLNVTLMRVIAHEPPSLIGERDQPLTSFSRGARIVEESGRLILELADPLGLSAGSHASRPQIAIRIPLPPEQQTGLLGADPPADSETAQQVGAWTMEIEAVGASLDAHHADLGTLHATSGEVHVEPFVRELGASVEGTFRVECPQVPGAIRIEGSFRTFLRER